MGDIKLVTAKIDPGVRIGRTARRHRRPRGGPRWGRWLAYVGIVVAAMIVGICVGVYTIARLSVPDWDGGATLTGLRAEVVVERDIYGIPRIEAQSMADAYRALGYVHAQDRMFQMEMNRRVGAGRLAEILGSSALPFDRLMRVMGFYPMAESTVTALSRAPRAAIEAYTQGVNAWLANRQGPLPPEFLLLRIDPEPWRAADSVVWGMLMALQLSDNWRTEVVRARIASHLTPEQMADLWPSMDRQSATTLTRSFQDYCCRDAAIFTRLAEAIPGLDGGGAPFAYASASNEWVVSGAHTETGSPLLANDPHLGFTAPGLWYLAEIVTPELSMSGATVPGVPVVLLGHNRHIAWGFTTTHADVQDLFIERIDPADPLRYLTPDGSEPFELRREEIFVRGAEAPEILMVRETRHGPVISDISDDAAALAGEGELIALAFTALAPGNMTTEALYDLNWATNWTEFTEALENYHAPIQNIAYADVDGHIGFYAPGRLPIRAGGNGMQPVPGWTGEFDWRGFAPFAAMPHRLDPPDGRLVNANNRVVADNYPYQVAVDWPDPQRAERINALLDENRAAGVETFLAMQTDIVSLAARELLPLLIERAVSAGDIPADSALETALGRLGAWDGRMDRTLPEPLIFTAWLSELGPGLYGDELGEFAPTYRRIRPQVLRTLLSERMVWCDDVTTAVTEDCDFVVRAALSRALGLLDEELGGAIADWRWGDLHRARFSHQIFGRVPLLRDLIDIEIETDGGEFTINRGSHLTGTGRGPFTHIHGPGYRAVYDLDNLANSRMVIATGQSGHVLSRHFDDLTRIWRDGEYLTLGRRSRGQNGFPASTFVLSPAP